MQIDFNNDRPIYLQLAEIVEDSILQGIYKPDTQLPSKTDIAVIFNINPATAMKGINILVSENIAYKKRGLGMFVSPEAVEIIKAKRRKSFYDNYVVSMLNEASKLGISKNEIIKLIQEGKKNE